MLDKQTIQESQYVFPYHYIPTLKGGEFSQTKNLFWGYEYLSYLNFVLNKLKLIQFHSLLDVGCGDGRFLYETKKIFPNANLLGIDSSQKAISLARVMNPDIEFICGNIEKINLNGQYDTITLIEVLEHIPPMEIPSFLQTLHRSLKTDGKLIITVPSDNLELNPKHYQHFNTRTIKNALEGSFKVRDIFYLNQKSLKTNIISKLLSNRFFILNYKKLIKIIYSFYVNNLLITKENDAQRICVVCRKK